MSFALQDLHRDVEIKAANGKSVRAVTVFAYALKFFKDHVLEELSDQSATKILEADIQWVLTVPAIWKAPAKQFMRTAAYEVSKSTTFTFVQCVYISKLVMVCDWLSVTDKAASFEFPFELLNLTGVSEQFTVFILHSWLRYETSHNLAKL